MSTAEKQIPAIPSTKLLKYSWALLNNPLKAISNIIDNYGDISCLRMGDIGSIVFLNHPDYVKHVLKDNRDNYSRRKAIKQPAFSALQNMLGNGIFMSEGEDWEKQHKMLRTLFSPTSINSTLPILNEELALLKNRWCKQIAISNVINIEQEMHLLLFRIMLRTHVCETKDFPYEKILATLNKLMNASNTKRMFLSHLTASLLKPLGIKYHYNKPKVYLELLDSLVEDLINDLVNHRFVPSGLFATMLIDYELGGVTKQDIRDQLLNFLFAGFDTTSTGITFTLYNLAANLDVQEFVRLEISEANDKQFDTLEKVVKESFRLYPPVWSFAHESVNDDTICGYHLPAKTLVLISSYALHRHKDFWINPNLFNPANFEKENFKGKTFAYIPFGQGKRMCIGRALADYQIMTIIPYLLREFSFVTTNSRKPIINPNIVIKATKPIKLQVSLAS